MKSARLMGWAKLRRSRRRTKVHGTKAHSSLAGRSALSLPRSPQTRANSLASFRPPQQHRSCVRRWDRGGSAGRRGFSSSAPLARSHTPRSGAAPPGWARGAVQSAAFRPTAPASSPPRLTARRGSGTRRRGRRPRSSAARGLGGERRLLPRRRPHRHRLGRPHGADLGATTGTEIKVLRGHEASVQSAAFSPDGARIVTASVDCTARIWDTTTGAVINSSAGTRTGEERRLLRRRRAHRHRLPRSALRGSGRDGWDRDNADRAGRAVSAPAVHNGNIALGDALGRVHVFEAEEFLRQKGNAS